MGQPSCGGDECPGVGRALREPRHLGLHSMPSGQCGAPLSHDQIFDGDGGVGYHKAGERRQLTCRRSRDLVDCKQHVGAFLPAKSVQSDCSQVVTLIQRHGKQGKIHIRECIRPCVIGFPVSKHRKFCRDETVQPRRSRGSGLLTLHEQVLPPRHGHAHRYILAALQRV